MDERDKSLEEIRAEGSRARMSGAAVGANPYPSSSPEAAVWERGWSAEDKTRRPSREKRRAVETPTG
jgi:hypothetical protein